MLCVLMTCANYAIGVRGYRALVTCNRAWISDLAVDLQDAAVIPTHVRLTARGSGGIGEKDQL